MCSTASGSCRRILLLPNKHCVLLAAPNNGDLGGWFGEISFKARVVTCILLLGFIMIVVHLIVKCLGNRTSNGVETEPMMHVKPNRWLWTYGTIQEDDDEESGASSNSSAESCVICYEECRDCFFLPCRHGVTCLDCAHRIVEEGSGLCPICRSLIHKIVGISYIS